MFGNQTESPIPMVIAFGQGRGRRIARDRFGIEREQNVAPNGTNGLPLEMLRVETKLASYR
jgi:hypothetical protein